MTGLAVPDTVARGFRRFLGDEKGATAIEYSVMAAGIGVAVATAITLLGTNVLALFNQLTGLF